MHVLKVFRLQLWTRYRRPIGHNSMERQVPTLYLRLCLSMSTLVLNWCRRPPRLASTYGLVPCVDAKLMYRLGLALHLGIPVISFGHDTDQKAETMEHCSPPKL